MIITDILFDGLFAAFAGMGFGVISNPDRDTLPYIAILAAMGHAFRFVLINYTNTDIATASFCAALVIGMTSMVFGRLTHTPTTCLYIPALLPMIPGMYAYKTVFALILFLQNLNTEASVQLMHQLLSNLTVTVIVVATLAIGATTPTFIFKKWVYSMTREKKKA